MASALVVASAIYLYHTGTTNSKLSYFSNETRTSLISGNIRKISEHFENQCAVLNIARLTFSFQDEIIDLKCTSAGSNKFYLSKAYTIYFDQEQRIVLSELDYRMNLSDYNFIAAITALILVLMNVAFYNFLNKFYQRKSQQLLYFKEQEMKISVSRKLAHDIRSPLSTLNLISSKISDENLKELQQAVVHQINGIAEKVLEQTRLVKSHSYGDIVEQIKHEYTFKQSTLNRTFTFHFDSYFKNIKVDAPDFLYSGLNNLIQNSIDATSVLTGQIAICATATKNFVTFTVTDNGCGMSENVLSKIGEKEITFGKLSSGNGIGVLHLAQALKSIEGNLRIQSQPSSGTEVQITIPINLIE